MRLSIHELDTSLEHTGNLLVLKVQEGELQTLKRDGEARDILEGTAVHVVHADDVRIAAEGGENCGGGVGGRGECQSEIAAGRVRGGGLGRGEHASEEVAVGLPEGEYS